MADALMILGYAGCEMGYICELRCWTDGYLGSKNVSLAIALQLLYHLAQPGSASDELINIPKD